MSGMNTALMAAQIENARITDVLINDDTLSVDLEDGRTISVPIVFFPRLSYATPAERDNWEIIGRGTGIHWEDLDEYIGVGGIILGQRSGEGPTSFARWLAGRKAREDVEMVAPQLQLHEQRAPYVTAEAVSNAAPRRLLGFSLTKYIEAALAIAEYEKGETGAITAIVPEKRGFFSQGDTFEEARENLRDAIEGNVLLSLQLGISIPRIEGVYIEESVLNAAA